MIPGTTLADLDDVHLELAVFGSHLGQLAGLLDAALIAPELIPVHVGDVGGFTFLQIGQDLSVGSPWNFAALSR